MTPKTPTLNLLLLLGYVVVDAVAEMTTPPLNSLESNDHPHFVHETLADFEGMSPSLDIFEDGLVRDEFGHIVPECKCFKCSNDLFSRSLAA